MMTRASLLSAFAVLVLWNVAEAQSLAVQGDDVTPTQKEQFAAFFLSQCSVKLDPVKAPELEGIVVGQLYEAVITQKDSDLVMTEKRRVFYDGSSFWSTPSRFPDSDSSRKVPYLLKSLDKKFQLQNDADSRRFLAALDKLYPLARPLPDDFVKRIRHEGNHWVFLRGRYGSHFVGFLVTTSDDGAITDVQYSKHID